MAKTSQRLLFLFANILSLSSQATCMSSQRSSLGLKTLYDSIQEIIGTDAGDRGMKPLIVPGDLQHGAEALANLGDQSTVIVLSGFPCCVNCSPPTETDGPPGTFAIARAAAAMGHRAVIVTDACNQAVFAEALKDLTLPSNCGPVSLEIFPSIFSDDDEKRFRELCADSNLLISCERAGPAKDGVCYTMRGIDMNEKGLIAPLHRMVRECGTTYVAIGDGGNELGMGKVIGAITKNPKITNGDKIGCVISADFLIAASVSNWGGYALAASSARAYAEARGAGIEEWVGRCLPTEEEEIALLDRCVAVGCRDGVSGEVEATVDGMPLATSMKCLNDIRAAALAKGTAT